MTIHERALIAAQHKSYQEYRETYLRALLNDPEMVEKVADEIKKTDNRMAEAFRAPSFTELAEVALQTIKDEVGL